MREIGRLVREYLSAGFSGNRLLHEVALTILKDDSGQNLLPNIGPCLTSGRCAKTIPLETSYSLAFRAGDGRAQAHQKPICSAYRTALCQGGDSSRSLRIGTGSGFLRRKSARDRDSGVHLRTLGMLSSFPIADP